MKKILFSTLIVNSLVAGDLANPDDFNLLKSFGPPKPIMPKTAQSIMLKNQFDHTNREEYFNITKNIDNRLRPLKFTSGFYGKSFYDSILFQARGANFYSLANINFTKANSYEDGAADRVDFGYERFNQALILGFVPNEFSESKFVFLHDNIKDEKQPEHTTDPVKTERFIYKFDTRIGEEDLSNTLRLGFKFRDIKRRSNNFELRKPKPTKPKMFVKVDRKIYDFDVNYDNTFKNFHNKIGFAYKKDELVGKRYRKMPSKDILNAYRFPDLDMKKFVFKDEISYKFNEMNKLALGVNYEINKVKANKFDAKLKSPIPSMPFFPNAKMLYKKYYGIDFDGKKNKNAFSIESKYEFKPNDLQKYSLNFGQIQRIGDETQRFNSLFGPKSNPDKGIIGNPNLENEKHNFIKFSSKIKNNAYKGYLNSIYGDGLSFGSSLMFDEVKNLIIFDRARKQAGIKQNDKAVIFRNVDARIITASAFAKYNFTSNFASSIKIFYAYGQNKDDSRALYQIRPFEANLNFDYKDYFSLGTYSVGSAVRLVSKQHRTDENKDKGLGIDRNVGGFALFDAYAGLN